MLSGQEQIQLEKAVPLSHYFGATESLQYRRFLSPSAVMQLAPKQIIFQEGDNSAYHYIVIRGMVKTYRLLNDGRRLIIGFSGAGDIVGMACKGVYSCSADSVSSVTLSRISCTKFASMMAEDPAISRRMLDLAYSSLQAAHDTMVLLGRKNAIEKIAYFLLGYAAKAMPEENGEIEIELPMTRADIADYLGLTTETVSRTMSKLKSRKIIISEGPRVIKLKNIDELRQIADSFDM
jgi:CRP/FNR family transcriptional regulator